MKKAILFLLASGLAGAMTAQAAATAGTVAVAVVDTRRVLVESTQGKEVVARLNQATAAKRAEIDKINGEISVIAGKLIAASTAPAAIAELRKTAAAKQKQAQAAQSSLQQSAQADERREVAALEAKIGPVIKAYLKEKRYTVVLDAQAGIIYRDDAVDVTEDVLKRVNSEAVPPAKPAAQKP